MSFSNLLYSLKVWITSVLAAPILWAGATVASDGPLTIGLNGFVWMYVCFVIMELIFSFVTWIIFFLMVETVVSFVFEPILRDWLIFISGVSLTAITFLGFFSLFGCWGDHDFFYLMLANCLCIGWGSWFYKLTPQNA